MIAPPRLRSGDRIGVVAPSGPVLRRLVERGARALEREGFRVILARHVFDHPTVARLGAFIDELRNQAAG